jgi:hypothetical protein
VLPKKASEAPDAARKDWEHLVDEIVPLFSDSAYCFASRGNGKLKREGY